MSKSKQEWFIAERALALMHLTRRDDLIVTEAGRDVGLNFLVCITGQDGEKSLRQCGVFLRGTKSPVTEEQLNRALRPAMQSFQRTGQFPDPVSLFHCTMD